MGHKCYHIPFEIPETTLTALIDRLEALLESGQDNLLLRFGLGKAHAEQENYKAALKHLEQAVIFDPMHSSSWFWLGRSSLGAGDISTAVQHLQQAITTARQNGDNQTVKMAEVFLRRAQAQISK